MKKSIPFAILGGIFGYGLACYHGVKLAIFVVKGVTKGFTEELERAPKSGRRSSYTSYYNRPTAYTSYGNCYDRDNKPPNAADPLKDFLPISAYPAYEGMETIKPRTHQTEVNKMAKLISAMVTNDAPSNDITRVARHYMVICNALEHSLDWKQSYDDHKISELFEKYKCSLK